MEKVKYTGEFIFRASPTILYKFFTVPGNLIRWYCDEVDIQGNTYTFSWEGEEEVAELVEDIENERLRFKWEDADTEEEYFEYAMSVSPVTGETILEVTDFVDEEGDLPDQQQFWETIMQRLRASTGG